MFSIYRVSNSKNRFFFHYRATYCVEVKEGKEEFKLKKGGEIHVRF